MLRMALASSIMCLPLSVVDILNIITSKGGNSREGKIRDD
jgi:hypothetical protein